MLPQLKTDVYGAQLFWLGCSFGLLFFCMRYLVWPRLEALGKQRADTLEGIAKRTEDLRAKTKAMIEEDAAMLDVAKKKAAHIINDTMVRTQQSSQEALKALEKTYEKKLENLKQAYAENKNTIVKEAQKMAGPLQDLFTQRFLPEAHKKRKH